MFTFYENKSSDFLYNHGHHLGFSPHLHKHIEMIYMIEGRCYTHVDGNDSYLEAGDIFITFPNQIHSYETYEIENYHIFIFSPDLAKEYMELFQNKVPTTQILKSANEDKTLMKLIEEIIKASSSDTLYSTIEMRGYLLSILSRIFRKLPFRENNLSDLTNIQRILTYCQKNYRNQITLDDAHNDLHISKYHISHLMKEKVHKGYTDYINAIRISEACHLLTTTDLSITKIAYQVGFNTTRTFNRSFIKNLGKSPSEYKNMLFEPKKATSSFSMTPPCDM